MAVIRKQIVALSLDTIFKKPMLFKDSQSEMAGLRCLEALGPYGLRPAQIALRRFDDLFNYQLFFTLFNNNFTFEFSHQKLHLEFQNATGSADLEILVDCVAKIFERVPLPDIASTSIVANAHAFLQSPSDVQQFLAKYSDPEKGIISGGAVGNVRCTQWPEEIHFHFERSVAFPDAIFLFWTTLQKDRPMARDDLTNFAAACGEAAGKFDLTYADKEEKN